MKTALQLESESMYDADDQFDKRRDRAIPARIESLRSEVNTILNNANGRPLTSWENDKVNAIQIEAERLGTVPMARIVRPGQPTSNYSTHTASRSTTATLQTSDGTAVHCLAPSEKFADLPAPDGDNRRLSLGKAIRGLITGRWEGAQAERLAMSEGSNVGGGYLVPPAFSRELIDLARAASVCVQAGAVSVPWTGSDTFSMAAVKTDPVFELKTENSAFTGSDIAFEQYTMTAKTIGTVVKASRELAEDSANFAPLITSVLAKAFAAELDRQCLNGSGSQELVGLLNKTNIPNSTSGGGAAAWETFATAASVVRVANHEPSSYVCHPTIASDLDALTSGDGDTSAKLWLPAPPSLATVKRFATTSCPLASSVVGDFSGLAIGIRQEAQLEISTTAGDSFAAHQVWIKLTWRGDCCAFRPAGFATITGLTS